MSYRENQIYGQLSGTSDLIKDSIAQLYEYLSRPMLMDKNNLNNFAQEINKMDLNNARQICENSKNILDELNKIINEEEKRRKYTSSLSEISKKGVIRKSLKEKRKERIRINSNPYALHRFPSVCDQEKE